MCLAPTSNGVFPSRQGSRGLFTQEDGKMARGLFTQEDGKMVHEHESSYRRWTTFDAQASCQKLVPGLQDVLAAVGLASYVMLAASWCLQSGAAFLSELIEDEDTFVDFWDTLKCPDRGRIGELKQAIVTRVRTDSSPENQEEEQTGTSWNSFLPRQAERLTQQQEEQEDNSELHDQMSYTSYQYQYDNSIVFGPNQNSYQMETGMSVANANATAFGFKFPQDQHEEIDLKQHSHYHSELGHCMRTAFATRLSSEQQQAILDAFTHYNEFYGYISYQEAVSVVESFGFELHDAEAKHVQSKYLEFEGQMDAGYVEFDTLCAIMAFKYLKQHKHQHSMVTTEQRKW